MQADGGGVGDVHAHVEGQLVDERLGAEAVAVQQLHSPRHDAGQSRRRSCR